jgi:hypothetical protein
MPKLEIKDKKELIRKLLDFMVTDEYVAHEYVSLKKTGPISATLDGDGQKLVLKFNDPKPHITINLDYLPDPTGKLDEIVVTESQVYINVDGLPDVRIPIVS